MAVQVDVHREPLVAVRRALDGADEAVLAVAFVQQRGVNLLDRQLVRLPSGRLVAKTVFGSTTAQGLEGAQRHGLGVRVFNPPRGTFHPKLYVARHGDRLAAAVGSANLTSGLVANAEAVALLYGSDAEPALRELWDLAILVGASACARLGSGRGSGASRGAGGGSTGPAARGGCGPGPDRDARGRAEAKLDP